MTMLAGQEKTDLGDFAPSPLVVRLDQSHPKAEEARRKILERLPGKSLYDNFCLVGFAGNDATIEGVHPNHTTRVPIDCLVCVD